ncbi:hypothetical protein T4B_9529 [Trichinella pseudospiralis]|uniref:Uncharacterized protein n=1 Tax=Trichinella pseudospiralis TaxID=6337 RepID=A0A0V1K2A9_TRIPS|nr:hypothetical protein T4A_7795 [Trichinella pseudospiralis]KRZ20656.1 hypothetical protein T4B_9529 [Trichinella pseudospiralis]KRZ41373.1 hypothetical protein T4C_1730 [Trichinella pseudospiralis]
MNKNTSQLINSSLNHFYWKNNIVAIETKDEHNGKACLRTMRILYLLAMLTVFPLSMKGDLKSKQNPVPMLVSGFDLNDFRGNGSVCNGNQCDDQQ